MVGGWAHHCEGSASITRRMEGGMKIFWHLLLTHTKLVVVAVRYQTKLRLIFFFEKEDGVERRAWLR